MKVIHVHLIFKKKNYYFGSLSAIFEHLDEGIGMTPVEMMRKIIEDERYACITIAEAV